MYNECPVAAAVAIKFWFFPRHLFIQFLSQSNRLVRRSPVEFSFLFGSKMAEVLLVAFIWAMATSLTITADHNFSFCPSLCTCKKKIITCPAKSLPVRLPPESSIIRIGNEPPKKLAASIPARAFQLSEKNENLTIFIFNINISKISAHAFDGLTMIKTLAINNCDIGELEKFSISDIKVTNRISMIKTSIGIIRQLAFHNVNSKYFFIYKSNITRFSNAAFNQMKIGDFRLFKSNFAHIESNAFGLWTVGIDFFKFKYNKIGSFECNEASNETSVSAVNLIVNCSCSALWILKNTSSFYQARSQFQCQEKPVVSLMEMEDSLMVSCANQTEAMDQICSPMHLYRQKYNDVGVRPIRAASTRHLMSVSLFLFNLLFLLEINAFIQ